MAKLKIEIDLPDLTDKDATYDRMQEVLEALGDGHTWTPQAQYWTEGQTSGSIPGDDNQWSAGKWEIVDDQA